MSDGRTRMPRPLSRQQRNALEVAALPVGPERTERWRDTSRSTWLSLIAHELVEHAPTGQLVLTEHGRRVLEIHREGKR